MTTVKVDFHTHTRISDGVDPLYKLIENAYRTGITALAVTDHDTIDAFSSKNLDEEKGEDEVRCKEEESSGQRVTRFEWTVLQRDGPVYIYKGMEIIPGIEFSARMDYEGKMLELHILALYVDPLCIPPAVSTYLDTISEARINRVKEMASKRGINYEENVLPFSRHSKTPTRLHLGRAIYEQGRVGKGKPYTDAFEAMRSEFPRGSKGYITIAPRDVLLPAQQVLTMICELNAVPVWAHPGYSEGGVSIEDIARTLHSWADGKIFLEAYSRNLNPHECIARAATARKLGIPVLFGSDYHGFPMKSALLGWEVEEVHYKMLREKMREWCG